MITGRLVADRVSAASGIIACDRMSGYVAAAGFVLVVVLPGPVLGIIGFSVIGVGIAAVVPMALRSAGRKYPHNPGRGVAAVASGGSLALLAAPSLVGGLTDLGGPRLPFACMGALVVLIAALAPSLARDMMRS